ncbi:hypothetical protein [Pedobacter sp.]|jgi:hypothetical protein|uniref:hypothetical protein n=1 Tax=Pedobacter sp. TaxID=1411316 RepID=UPI002B5AC8AD|nr:hypothetical protein [Pedobacter sp.]HWW42242.1 hypothetical protein [Pedobacter sp.]
MLKYFAFLLVFLFGCQKNTYVMKSIATFDDLNVTLSIAPDTRDSSWVTLTITNNLPVNRYYISKSIDVKWDEELDVLNLRHLATISQDSTIIKSLGLYLKRSHSYTINKHIANKFDANTYVSLQDVSLTLASMDMYDTTAMTQRKPRLMANFGSILVAPRNYDNKRATDTAVALFMDRISGTFLDAKLEVKRRKDGTALLALHLRNESKEFPISTGLELNPIWDHEGNNLYISVVPQLNLEEDTIHQVLIPPGAAKTIIDSVPDYFNANTTIMFTNTHYVLKNTSNPAPGPRPILSNYRDAHNLAATFNIQQL